MNQFIKTKESSQALGNDLEETYRGRHPKVQKSSNDYVGNVVTSDLTQERMVEMAMKPIAVQRYHDESKTYFYDLPHIEEIGDDRGVVKSIVGGLTHQGKDKTLVVRKGILRELFKPLGF